MLAPREKQRLVFLFLKETPTNQSYIAFNSDLEAGVVSFSLVVACPCRTRCFYNPWLHSTLHDQLMQSVLNAIANNVTSRINQTLVGVTLGYLHTSG